MCKLNASTLKVPSQLDKIDGIHGLQKKTNYYYNFTKFNRTTGKPFHLICRKEAGNRYETGNYVNHRYINVLDPNINRSDWSIQEDNIVTYLNLFKMIIKSATYFYFKHLSLATE